jgi:hypothetical protein
MKLPDYPVPGKPVEASWGRQIVDYLRSITPRSSADILVKTTANGTTFEPFARSGSGAAAGGIDFDFVFVGGVKYAVTAARTSNYLQVNANGTTEWVPAMPDIMPTGSEVYDVTKNHIHLPGETAGNS